MNINRIFIGFIMMAGIFSCDNDINITADPENIPAVFALIDTGEDVNYLRIERAFIDKDISPEELAQNPDFVYYGPDVQARITNLRNDALAILERVNLEDEGFVRDEPNEVIGSAFLTSPNIGYKLDVSDLGIEENDMLKFELLGPDEETFTEATTMVVGDHTIGNQPASPLRLRYGRELAFTLRSDEQAAVFYDLRLFINYTEEDSDGVIEDRTLEWLLESELERGQNSGGDFLTQTTFRMEDGEDFYQFLAANIKDPEGQEGSIARKFVNITLQYDAGGQELFDFINIGQANTGITSGQIIPTFTNLSNNAVGLFSSRRTILSVDREDGDKTFRLDTEASDSLRDSRLTGPLNFN